MSLASGIGIKKYVTQMECVAFKQTFRILLYMRQYSEEFPLWLSDGGVFQIISKSSDSDMNSLLVLLVHREADRKTISLETQSAWAA